MDVVHVSDDVCKEDQLDIGFDALQYIFRDFIEKILIQNL